MKHKFLAIGICMLMILGGISVSAISIDYNGSTGNSFMCLNDPPSSFDLRDVNGTCYVTGVRDQDGYGTCWAHAVMAGMESNLLITGNWENAGEQGEPDLSESHLDWWNGFNKFNNDDVPGSSGLTVHSGGECRTASAYFSRGEGPVREIDAPYNETSTPPERYNASYHNYYVNDIEWYDIGDDLHNMNLIKEKIMTYGAINVGFCYADQFIDNNFTYYQPPSSPLIINHDVAIIGWDDNKATPAPEKGAWLCKNSWGAGWGLNGYFWISYYDKYCCHYDAREWTATFQNVEPLPYNQIYYHDYHGWQDTLNESTEAFNAFRSLTYNVLQAVSFFTAADDVDYDVRIYDSFENNELKGELSYTSGTIPIMGFHTVHLDHPVYLSPEDDFYIYLKLSNGGQSYDRTIKANEWWAGVRVQSVSHPGESYYNDNGVWNDLYDFDNTANFCIKGLAVSESNQPPETPIITGPTNGKIKVGTAYNFTTIDPDDNQVSYYIDWGDGTNSGWIGPYTSGELITQSHIWSNKGDYTIKAKAKDVYGNESSWGTLKVTMPRSYDIPFHLFLERFFERFPHIFPILRHLLGY
jgi:C1A family cysteine protease